MNQLFSRRRLSASDVLEQIESAEGYLGGFELLQGNRAGPWVWVRVIPQNHECIQRPCVSHCEVTRHCSPEETADFSELLTRGDAVLRVISVETGNRFAVLWFN